MIDVFLGFAFLASATVANKYVLKVLSLSLVVGLRMLGAGIILFFYYRRKSHRLSFNYFKKDIWMLLGISLLTMLIPALFKAFALKYMYASKAAFLASLDPFVTALYSVFFWHERLTQKKIIGIILGFSGTLILLASSGQNEMIVWSIFSYPEISALLAMSIGRLGWMFVQQVLRKETYTAPEINGLLMSLSGILAFVMPFLLALGRALVGLTLFDTLLPSYTFTDATSFLQIIPSTGISTPFIFLVLIYSIVIGNVVGYTMYANFLKHHSATFVSLAGFSVPLYVYLFSAVLLKEPLSLNFLAASAVTFVGLLIFYQDEIKTLHTSQWHLFKNTKNS